MVQEDLKILIEGDYSIVDVKYHLKNNAYKDSEITYGFPIRFIRNEVEYEWEWQDDYLPKVEFILDETKLDIKHQVDLSTQEVKVDEYGTIDMKTSWHVVDFSILKGNTAILNVKYKLKNGFEDWATTKSFFPSYGKRRVSYDFSPAKKWGDGIVSDFKIEVDARDVYRDGSSFKISGLELEYVLNLM